MLHGKFGVNWQPHWYFIVVFAGKFDCEFDAIVRVVTSFHIFRESISRQHIFQQVAELPFAPAASCLHVREHTLQSTNITRQLLHCAKPLMHLLQPITDQLEGFAQPLLERALQLFVDGRAHLVDLFCVVVLQLPQSNIDNGPDAFQRSG